MLKSESRSPAAARCAARAAAALLAAAGVGGAGVASAADSLVITGATIIDGTGKAPAAGTIVIKDGRIAAIGSDAKAPSGAKKIDARGKYIIPGLMDANIHLFLNLDLETMVKFEGQYQDIIIEGAQLALKTGQTTVFDTWGPRAPLIQAREMINSGKVPGARFFIAGNILGFGGPFSSDFREDAAKFVSKSFVKRTNAMWEDNTGQQLLWMGPEEVRQEIRKYVALGVDFLKYGASGHRGLDMRFISLSPRTQQVIVEEGHRAGITVQAHTSSPESLDLGIEAGLDILTHCDASGMTTPIPPETLKKMAERKIPCSILPITQRRMDASLKKRPDNYFTQFEQTMKVNEKNMIKAGVPLLLSTDAGVEHPVLNAEAAADGEVVVDSRTAIGEGHFNALQTLQELGMEPMEILKTATSNIAKAYKKDKDIGSLEPSKFADLVILDKNPLDDAKNYRAINAVIKEGKQIDIAALPLKPLITSQKPPADLKPKADTQ